MQPEYRCNCACRQADKSSGLWRPLRLATRFRGSQIKRYAVIVDCCGKHLCRYCVALAVEPATLCLRIVIACHRKIVLQRYSLRMVGSKLQTRGTKVQREGSRLVRRERCN